MLCVLGDHRISGCVPSQLLLDAAEKHGRDSCLVSECWGACVSSVIVFYNRVKSTHDMAGCESLVSFSYTRCFFSNPPDGNQKQWPAPHCQLYIPPTVLPPGMTSRDSHRLSNNHMTPNPFKILTNRANCGHETSLSFPAPLTLPWALMLQCWMGVMKRMSGATEG